MRVRIVLGVLVIALGILACTKSTERPKVILYPSPTPNATNTPLVVFVEITNSPEPTQTPELVIITQTPNEFVTLCVVADEAVYLRPSPSTTYYPLDPLPKDSKVIFTGTRDGDWLFINIGNKSGWVNGKYLGECNGNK